jgi:hypothetical protein
MMIVKSKRRSFKRPGNLLENNVNVDFSEIGCADVASMRSFIDHDDDSQTCSYRALNYILP